MEGVDDVWGGLFSELVDREFAGEVLGGLEEGGVLLDLGWLGGGEGVQPDHRVGGLVGGLEHRQVELGVLEGRFWGLLAHWVAGTKNLLI